MTFSFFNYLVFIFVHFRDLGQHWDLLRWPSESQTLWVRLDPITFSRRHSNWASSALSAVLDALLLADPRRFAYCCKR